MVPPYVITHELPNITHFAGSEQFCARSAYRNYPTWVPSGKHCEGARQSSSIDTLANKFCERFAGKRILLVGDSLSAQWYLSLAYILGRTATGERQAPHFTHAPPPCQGATVRLLATQQRPFAPFCHAHPLLSRRTIGVLESCAQDGSPSTSLPFEAQSSGSVCQGLVSLRFIRNGHVGVDEGKERLARSSGGACEAEPSSNDQPWLYAAAESDVVILNRGAWGPRFDGGSFRRGVRATMAALAQIPRRPRVVWRGTSAGIPKCWSLNDTLTEAFAFNFTELPWLQSHRSVQNFSYHRFEPLNAIARQEVEQAGHAYLDTYWQTAKRPGGRLSHRRDCLHFCLPGPPDVWSRLLFLLLS